MTYASPSTINMTEGMPAIFEYLDVVTLSWFSNLLLLGVWLITTIFYYKSRGDIAESLAVSGFIVFIFSLIMWLAGFISGTAFTFVIIASILSAAFLIFDKK